MSHFMWFPIIIIRRTGEERSGGVAYDDYGEMMPNGVRR